MDVRIGKGARGQDRSGRMGKRKRRVNQRQQKVPSPSSYSLPFLNNFVLNPLAGTKGGRTLMRGVRSHSSGHKGGKRASITRRRGAAQCKKPGPSSLRRGSERERGRWQRWVICSCRGIDLIK